MKKIKILLPLIVLVTLVVLVLVVGVRAQTYSFTMPRSVISGGGLGGSAGGYTINSSLGQPVTGSISQGDYNLSSGFWAQILDGIEEFLTFLPLILR